MSAKRIFCVVALACGMSVALMGGRARANDSYRTVENSSPQEIVDAMSNKAVRGIANAATGWLEFPKQIYLTIKEDGVAKGIFVGPLRGAGMTLIRTMTGAVEALTFFVAYPGFYDPYIDPAFAWQKE
jgi:putative exosortase-associated protein (TIGR04073 family)